MRPPLDHDDAVGERDRLGDVVGDQDRGEALVEPDALQQLLHLDAGQRVERAERLVERQDLRLADQRAGQRHALLLAAGQHRRPLAGAIGEADLAQACRAPAPLASAPAAMPVSPTSTLSTTRAQGSSRGSWNMMRVRL